MGLLRIIFAISVLLHHCGGIFNYYIMPKQVAILSFFIISGFYMALILDKKYVGKNSSYRLFITNRFLRIYPVYWLILFLTVFFALLKLGFNIGTPDNFISHYILYYPSENNFIFETINFILRNLTLIFNFDYFFTINPTSGYLIILQAWTLQIELLFYLLVPFIFRLSKKWFYLFFLFYLIIFYGIISKFNLIPSLSLTYFFLSYLLYFLLGMISYSLYVKLKTVKLPRKVVFSFLFIFIIYLLSYNLVPYKIHSSFLGVENLAYYLIFLAILPFAFLFSKDSLLDKFLGELSYPIYISHLFFIKILNNFYINNSLVSILVTILGSLVIIKFFINPIDKYRQSRLK